MWVQNLIELCGIYLRMVYSTTLSIALFMQCWMTEQVVAWKFVEGRNLCCMLSSGYLPGVWSLYAYKLQTPGNYPEESIQHPEHGESSKSRCNLCYDLGVCLEASTYNLDEIARSGPRFEPRRSANILTTIVGHFSSWSTFYASCTD